MTNNNRKDPEPLASVAEKDAVGVVPSSNSASEGLASSSLDAKSLDGAPEIAGGNQGLNDKTAKGRKSPSKKIGNRNALCHGVFSNEFVLPWESAAEFEKLHADFREEWKPSGCSEEAAILDLTSATWIKWRAMRMVQLQYYQDPYAVELLEAGKTSWQDILSHQMGVPERTQVTLDGLGEVLQGMNDMLELIRSRPYWTDTNDGKKIQSQLSQLTNEVSCFMDETKGGFFPLIKKMAAYTEKNMTEFLHAYDSDQIEKQVRTMAAIDARIDKILRRLTSLKEYKRMAASQTQSSRLLEPPSGVIGASSATKPQSTGDGDASGAATANAEGEATTVAGKTLDD